MSKRRALTWTALVVVGLFVFRFGVNRARIVNSISLALGRPVEVASVKFRLLPRPGFDLENFVVHDDPALGAEPMLHAQEVTASLRLISLLRGRIEIARLDLAEPSVNVALSPQGHWNLESLLERNAKTPVAPTAKSKSDTRAGFPYIEADHARINFKIGPEKKPYALTEATFAVWQDSENAWGMRLKATPVRTDFNMTDTGVIKVSGSWQRASALRETPLQFNLQWQRGQLGQATKLAYGNDKGWRGTILLDASFSGTPADLQITTTTSIQDFRRYDIFDSNQLKLSAQCSARYSSLDHVLSDINCQAPVGNGNVALAGVVSSPLLGRNFDLTLSGHEVPVPAVLSLFRHVRQGFAYDLAADGTLQGTVRIRRTGEIGSQVSVWEGTGETSNLRLSSNSAKTELVLGNIPFEISSANTGPTLRSREFPDIPPLRPEEVRFNVGPFNLPLGRPVPATVHGSISRSTYAFRLEGDAQVQKLLLAARIFAIPEPQIKADGSARVELELVHRWSDLAPIRATGKMQLHAVRADLHGVSAPVDIVSANLALSENEISVQNLKASIADTAWRGELTLERPCTADSCQVQVDLHGDQVTTDQLNEWLNPNAHKQPWYHFLSSEDGRHSFLLRLRATGKLGVDRFLIRKLVANRVSANVQLDEGKLKLTNLRANVLGGKHEGEWSADFAAIPPHYSGDGTLQNAALGQLADLMNDGWITGSITASYQATTTGLAAPELIAAATGKLQVDMRDGLLPHITLPETTSPLQVDRLLAHLALRNGVLEFQQAKCQTAAGTYQVSGTASLNRVLDLKITRAGASGFNITGTLTEPHISQAVSDETQAELKP